MGVGDGGAKLSAPVPKLAADEQRVEEIPFSSVY